MKVALEALSEVVAPGVLLDAIETSQRLTELGIPHALIGGLAVGLHGHPRATKDVDFLVGAEAFILTEPIIVYREELAELARVGEIDLMGVPPGHEELNGMLALPVSGQVPVIPVEALVYLKLSANRHQDRADVHALLSAGAELRQLRDYLASYAPELLSRLSEIAGAQP